MCPPPTSLADAAQRSLKTVLPLCLCLDEFLDVFYTELDGDARQAMLDSEPPRTGSERDDAYLGAVAEHLARVWGLRIPDWSEAPSRVVATPWFVGSMGIGLSGLLLVESPIAFRRRIFTEAAPAAARGGRSRRAGGAPTHPARRPDRPRIVTVAVDFCGLPQSCAATTSWSGGRAWHCQKACATQDGARLGGC